MRDIGLDKGDWSSSGYFYLARQFPMIITIWLQAKIIKMTTESLVQHKDTSPLLTQVISIQTEYNFISIKLEGLEKASNKLNMCKNDDIYKVGPIQHMEDYVLHEDELLETLYPLQEKCIMDEVGIIQYIPSYIITFNRFGADFQDQWPNQWWTIYEAIRERKEYSLYQSNALTSATSYRQKDIFISRNEELSASVHSLLKRIDEESSRLTSTLVPTELENEGCCRKCVTF